MCEHCEAVAAALHSEDVSEKTAEEITAAEVEIARINADRDVTLAKISAGVEKDAVEKTTDAELVEAVTEAETLHEVIDTMAPEPEPAPAPVVVEAPAEPEAQPAATDLPAADEHHEPEHHESAKARGFFHG